MSQIAVAREAMRTRFEIVLHDPRRSVADLRAAGEEALDEIARWEALLSAFRPGSELALVNARAAQEPVRVDARVMAFLVRARTLSVATDGAFDPTVGPLLRLWGIGGDTMRRIPDETEIFDAHALVGMSAHVRLDEDAGTVAFDRPGVRLDPGALGKGYALDEASALLREAGIANALLHGGTSSVCAIGSDVSGDGWRIALRFPAPSEEHTDSVTLRDNSLSVSASAEGHTINPATGLPVRGARFAAVVAPTGAEAEALSTALLVRGEVGTAALRETFPAAQMLIRGEQAEEPHFASA